MTVIVERDSQRLRESAGRPSVVGVMAVRRSSVATLVESRDHGVAVGLDDGGVGLSSTVSQHAVAVYDSLVFCVVQVGVGA